MSDGGYPDAVVAAAPAVEINEPTFPYEDVKDSIASFTKQFDAYIARKRGDISDKRVYWQRTRAENKESYKNLQTKIETFSNKHEEMVKNTKRENQEVDAVRSALSQLNIRREEMDRNRALLGAQMESLERRVKNKKEAIAMKEKELLVQQGRNEPELSFFQEKLALTINSTKPDFLEFIYTHIKEKDWAQPFRFTIDLTSKEYKVPHCEPMIPNMNDLLHRLNKSRDFFTFLKLVRRSFVNLAKASGTN
ncbi:kinetochore-associated Ndc80 complex subunit spc25 [Dimargaris cristalligena]|uniref:Kinetochore protein SPC25 n=1 Tax=Dimargaris cristalligena TaxID=215637 RepID=A0A4P9ZU06_9FUNG|nr:kinetochore-associated Ndc80 complex subunit spc25 [Dimargaris cristalligena]RKP37023.1 chromosome segregation protein Spc25-domain-containing protein [Dimargaris cristalligena]|eukprot:RKP37023.1 chromosome segregation protein Spc25-domain-containing protein [Dimargaris cristalligena]